MLHRAILDWRQKNVYWIWGSHSGGYEEYFSSGFARWLLRADFLFGVRFSPQNWGDIYLRNVGLFSPDYTALYSRKYIIPEVYTSLSVAGCQKYEIDVWAEVGKML
jgi:hypothetical protein